MFRKAKQSIEVFYLSEVMHKPRDILRSKHQDHDKIIQKNIKLPKYAHNNTT